MVDAAVSGEELQSRAIRHLVDALGEKHQDLEQQRKSPRYPFHVPVAILLKKESGAMAETCPAWALDISYEGVSLLTSCSLALKGTFFLNLEPVLRRLFTIRIEILHSNKLVPGIYRSGGVFRYH